MVLLYLLSQDWLNNQSSEQIWFINIKTKINDEI